MTGASYHIRELPVHAYVAAAAGDAHSPYIFNVFKFCRQILRVMGPAVIQSKTRIFVRHGTIGTTFNSSTASPAHVVQFLVTKSQQLDV
jgi:hypothetical protein